MEKVFVILFVVGFLGLGALIAGGVLFPVLPKLFHHKIEQVIFNVVFTKILEKMWCNYDFVY